MAFIEVLFCYICYIFVLICYIFDFLPFEINFLNALTILVPFLSFKGITHAYLLNKSIAHDKYLTPLLYLLNDCTSAKSTPQILPLNEE